MHMHACMHAQAAGYSLGGPRPVLLGVQGGATFMHSVQLPCARYGYFFQCGKYVLSVMV